MRIIPGTEFSEIAREEWFTTTNNEVRRNSPLAAEGEISRQNDGVVLERKRSVWPMVCMITVPTAEVADIRDIQLERERVGVFGCFPHRKPPSQCRCIRKPQPAIRS